MHALKTLVIGAAASAALLSTGCRTAPAAVEQEADGPGLFSNYCSPCHGEAATGNADIGAPNLTGLPEWYVRAQLEKFRLGRRGYHYDDIAGLRMRPMAQTLVTDEQFDAVAGYVASLPATEPIHVLEGGDAEKGKTSFATCTACHQADGKGNQALNAPPLIYASDWYLLTQLKNFKAGIRGTHPDDVTGAQMRPMSMTLADEQAMRDVIAYIQTL